MIARTSEISPIPPPLAKYVTRFVARSRKLATAQATARAGAFIIVWTLLWAIVDRLTALPSAVRCILLLTQLAAAVMLLFRPVRQLLRRDVPWHRAAAEIERREPSFGGELQTALAQLLALPRYRGSPALVAKLVEEANTKTTERDAAILLPLDTLFKSAGIAVASLLFFLALLPVSWLDLPRLVARELMPFSNIAAVTTTRLNVSPGSVVVIQGEPLTVQVHAQRLGDAQPVLRWRGDDPLWTSAVMTPAGAGFACRLSSVDRPFHYQISGGDAVSQLFEVRIVPRPAVSTFQIHYSFPPWTHLPEKTESNATGLLEGPVGTIADVSIVATESLSAAACIVDGKRIETIPTVDPCVRRAAFSLEHGGPWQISLTSAQHVNGSGPSAMAITALPAQAPLVRLLLPAGESELRLHPRDLLTLHYQASDDYGLRRLAASVAINDSASREVPLPVTANSRTQDDAFEIDLAKLAVSLGDVVTIAVTAENTAGLHSASEPCRVIVSPRSIDMNTQEREVELHAAARLAARLTGELTAASKALDESAIGDDKDQREQFIAPHLAVVEAAAAELTRSLLRATALSDSPESSLALSWLIDITQRVINGVGSTQTVIKIEAKDALRARLNQMQGPSQSLLHASEVLWRGERAGQLLAGQQDSDMAQDRAAQVSGAVGEALRRSAGRARDEQGPGCVELGVDPHAADLKVQLQRQVDEASQYIRQCGPVDFASAAAEWDGAGPKGDTGLVPRLIIASEAQALAPRGDFVWARDLQLAARAARQIDSAADIVPPTSPSNAEQPRHEYPGAIAAVQRIHELRRTRAPLDQYGDATQAADAARRFLRQWGGEDQYTLHSTAFDNASTAPSTMPSSVDPDLAALEAAAAQTQQSYDARMRLEKSSSASSSTRSAPDPAEKPRPDATAERLENLATQALQLQRETPGASAAQVPELTHRQHELTNAIQNILQKSAVEPTAAADEPQEDSPGDTREQAMNAIRSAQERLAAMSPQISNARQVFDLKSGAHQISDEAKKIASAASDDETAVANQMADEAQQSATAADQRVQIAEQPVSPDVASDLAATLRNFVPETGPAIETLAQQLAPSLIAMRQSESVSDAAGVDRNAKAAVESVAEAQRRLAAGLQTLLQRDLLTTAKWFSNHADKSLTREPANRSAALKLQRGASIALEQAWSDAVHRSAAAHIAAMPSLQAVLSLDDRQGDAMAAPGVAAPPPGPKWGKLQERPPDELSAPTHGADPVEYQDALRVYFRALAREENGGGR